ncbi:Histone-lysine N-methyltransferase [Fasciola gigantica]|uniref:Histone-lysine N-methyltransferase n=1 Tax=Fasciola gigantica TaxID=46835 RepID=A0A504YRU7_FASGI|nr:Histone-lysine N-methyltransferase [Fasciola gigantica]
MDDTFELGDLFWAKVGSHPWWPCMIYYTPTGESYVRNKAGKSACYHVQFLGPLVERAWVHPGNLIPFEGKKKFDEYVQDKLKNSRDKNERAKFDSRSTSSSRNLWVQSWKEAESAMNMPSEKRMQKFGRISVKSKVRRLSKAEEGEIMQLLSSVPLTLDEEAESLAAFLREEMEIRSEKNPDVDQKLLEDELRAQWPSFDIPTKRSYLQEKLGIFSSFPQDKNTPKNKSCMELTPKAVGPKIEKTQKKRTSEMPNRYQEQRELDIEIHRLIVSPAQYRYQPVCHMCEVYSNAPGQMFKCRGPCGRLVHPTCMRYKVPPPADNSREDRFRCPECLTGDFLCRICGKPGDTSHKSTVGPVILCQSPGCGRHFHRDCLLDWPGVITRPPVNEVKLSPTGELQLVKCPAHCCTTCVSELEEPSSKNSSLPGSRDQELLQCVRCPAAFHTGDLCTPAGSVEVSLSHIVCPRHYDQTLNETNHFKTQHPNWCFQCYSTVTEKVVCETCPTVYHKTCVQPSFGVWSEDKFTCMSCRRGVFPRYAQIVWAKIQHFRWWPCEIIHARNAPINILNMVRPEGTFPIHFLGSDEYQWIARGCILPYEIGLKTNAAKDSRGTKSVERAFTRALERAPRAHQLYVNHVLKRQLPLTSMHAELLPDEELLPPAAMDADIVVHRNLDEDLKTTATANMVLIESNVQKAEASKIASLGSCCTCKSSGDSSVVKKCTQETQCLNVMASVECTRQRCSFGDKDCGNRRFCKLNQKSEHDLFNVVRTVNRGYGVKTTVSFSQHALVMEFRGEVVDLDEANRRLVEALGPSALANLNSSRKGCQPLNESYVIRLGPDRDLALDAACRGNLARFINHSCEPNLAAECWVVDGCPRLGLFATRTIDPNEELTLDYVLADFLSTGLMGSHCLCLCGTDTCVSTLHLPSSFPPVVNNATEPEVSSQLGPVSPSAPDRRRSKRTDSAHAQTLDNKPQPEKNDRSEQVLSVVNLLAAAASNRSAARRERALIQPSTAAARASKDPSTGKHNASGGTGASDAASIKSEQMSTDSNLALRPPPHEDFCYRCGDGGELLLCDKASCPKAFHLSCLGLSSPPAGIWYCPWHYCDHCGHPSTHLCWRCPNSYCTEHAMETLIQVDELDKERWNLAREGLNTVTSSALVSSFRWICADHSGMRIHGPGHRPCLVPPEPQSNGSGSKSSSSRQSKTSNKASTTSQESMRTSESLESQLQKKHEELENVEPVQNASSSPKPVSGSRAVSNEPRRVEPLKVTLKRRLKAEMAAMESVGLKSDPSNDEVRKRPASSIASPPVSDRKRPRLGKETMAK